MKVKVSLHGCDDSTDVELDVTEAEYKTLEMMAGAVEVASEYGCQPTMTVRVLEL